MPLYIGVQSGNVGIKVREAILECSMAGKAITGSEVKNKVIKLIGCKERSIQDALSKLRAEDVVNFAKVSCDRGYDHQYWL